MAAIAAIAFVKTEARMTIAAWLLYAPGDEPEKPLKDARFNTTRATKVLASRARHSTLA